MFRFTLVALAAFVAPLGCHEPEDSTQLPTVVCGVSVCPNDTPEQDEVSPSSLGLEAKGEEEGVALTSCPSCKGLWGKPCTPEGVTRKCTPVINPAPGTCPSAEVVLCADGHWE